MARRKTGGFFVQTIWPFGEKEKRASPVRAVPIQNFAQLVESILSSTEGDLK
jgi:hypothetical protein